MGLEHFENFLLADMLWLASAQGIHPSKAKKVKMPQEHTRSCVSLPGKQTTAPERFEPLSLLSQHHGTVTTCLLTKCCYQQAVFHTC